MTLPLAAQFLRLAGYPRSVTVTGSSLLLCKGLDRNVHSIWALSRELPYWSSD